MSWVNFQELSRHIQRYYAYKKMEETLFTRSPVEIHALGWPNILITV